MLVSHIHIDEDGNQEVTKRRLTKEEEEKGEKTLWTRWSDEDKNTFKGLQNNSTRHRSKKLALGLYELEGRQNKQVFVWGYLWHWINALNGEKLTQWSNMTKVPTNFAVNKKHANYNTVIEKVDELVEHYDASGDGSEFEIKKNEAEQRGVRVLNLDGKEYWRFGPYKISGMASKGKIEELDVKKTSDNSKVDDYKIVFYRDYKPKEGTVEEIKNNRRFYLCIPKDKYNAQQIKFNFKTKQVKQKKIVADLYFFESKTYSWQNQLVAKTKDKGTGEDDIDVYAKDDIIITPPGGGTIIKVDQWDKTRLYGAEFVVFYYQAGTWEGNVTYTDDQGIQHTVPGEKASWVHYPTESDPYKFEYIAPNNPMRHVGTNEYNISHATNSGYCWATRHYVKHVDHPTTGYWTIEDAAGSDLNTSGVGPTGIGLEEVKNDGNFKFTSNEVGEIDLSKLIYPKDKDGNDLGRWYCAIETKAPKNYAPYKTNYFDNYFVLNRER